MAGLNMHQKMEYLVFTGLITALVIVFHWLVSGLSGYSAKWLDSNRFSGGYELMKGKGELKFNVGDILNQKAIFYQNSNDVTKRAYKGSDDNIWNTFQYGTNLSLTFSVNF
jgi:hypothetical protein